MEFLDGNLDANGNSLYSKEEVPPIHVSPPPSHHPSDRSPPQNTYAADDYYDGGYDEDYYDPYDHYDYDHYNLHDPHDHYDYDYDYDDTSYRDEWASDYWFGGGDSTDDSAYVYPDDYTEEYDDFETSHLNEHSDGKESHSEEKKAFLDGLDTKNQKVDASSVDCDLSSDAIDGQQDGVSSSPQQLLSDSTSVEVQIPLDHVGISGLIVSAAFERF